MTPHPDYGKPLHADYGTVPPREQVLRDAIRNRAVELAALFELVEPNRNRGFALSALNLAVMLILKAMG